MKAKLTGAYRQVSGQGGRTALTLYHNAGCGGETAELDPIAFSRTYVPPAMRSGLDYVLLSYYEDACQGIRPTAAAWTAYFRQLHALYPHASSHVTHEPHNGALSTIMDYARSVTAVHNSPTAGKASLR